MELSENVNHLVHTVDCTRVPSRKLLSCLYAQYWHELCLYNWNRLPSYILSGPNNALTIRAFYFSSINVFSQVPLSESKALCPKNYIISAAGMCSPPLPARLVLLSGIDLNPWAPAKRSQPMPTQHIPTLLGAACCVRLATVLRCVATCWVLLAQVWKWSNLSQQNPTCRNRVAKRAQHVAPNNVAICCVGMLRSFGRGLILSLIWIYWK